MLGEYTNKVPENNQFDPNFGTKFLGMLDMIFGSIEASLGVACVSGTGGVGTLFGCGALFAHGLDGIYTGGKQVWYGITQESLTHEALKTAIGDFGATAVDLGISILGGGQVLTKQTKIIESAQKTYCKINIRACTLDTELNGSIFFSGKGNKEFAERFAQMTGKKTLEMTKGGSWLKDQQITSQFGQFFEETLWRNLSKRYAKQASGEVYAFIYGASEKRIYYSIERPVLIKSSKVNELHEFTSPLYEYDLTKIAYEISIKEKIATQSINSSKNKMINVGSGVIGASIPNKAEGQTNSLIRSELKLSDNIQNKNLFFNPSRSSNTVPKTFTIPNIKPSTDAISEVIKIAIQAVTIGAPGGAMIGPIITPGFLGIGLIVPIIDFTTLCVATVFFATTVAIFLLEEKGQPVVGGIFDFSKGKYGFNNNQKVSIWLNEGTNIGCRSNQSSSTPGLVKNDVLLVQGHKHLLRVRGHAEKGVTAYLYVAASGKNIVWETVKLPETMGTVEVEFMTPIRNGLVEYEGLKHTVGVLFRSPKSGQKFWIENISVAPVDYPKKVYCFAPVIRVKSPIGVAYDFVTAGFGCFSGNGATVHTNSNALICNVISDDSTPGFEGTFNIIPNEMHYVRFEGRNYGNLPAYIWVDGVDSFRRVKLPTDQCGIIEFGFRAPQSGKALIPCRIGICYSAPCKGASMEIKSFVLAPVDCLKKEIDGHPLALTVKSRIGIAHQFVEMGLGCFQGNGATVNINGNGLICNVISNDSTPGFEGRFNIIPNEMHYIQFEGRNYSGVPAYIWVDGVDDSFRRVKLPKDQFGIIEFGFRGPQSGKALIPCRIGICYSAPCKGASMEIKSFVLAPVDCLKKEIDGHPLALTIKSRIGIAHQFVEMGLGCFQGNGATINMNGNGLICKVNSDDLTPGFEGRFNIIPNEMHYIQFEGRNYSNVPAYIWVDGVDDSFRRVKLPTDQFGMIEFGFRAPQSDKALIPCRIGICFSAPCKGSSMEIKSFVLAPVDCLKKEIDGHPVTVSFVSQNNVHQNRMKLGFK